MVETTRPWWSRWWAVVLWGALALLAVLPAAIGWLFWAWVPVDTTSGTDMQGDGGGGHWTQWLAAIAGLAVLLLPGMTARWARKAWLGYFLLGALASAVVLVVGLFMLGIV